MCLNGLHSSYILKLINGPDLKVSQHCKPQRWLFCTNISNFCMFVQVEDSLLTLYVIIWSDLIVKYSHGAKTRSRATPPSCDLCHWLH